MQCKDVELVVEQEGLAPLPEAARVHVAGCRHCQGFVADLSTIVSAAHALPAEVDPPARVWLSLQAQLELEGIIKTPVVSSQGERAAWWHGFGDLFRSRALATAVVGLLIIAAGVVELRQPPQVPVADASKVSAEPTEPGWQIPFKQTAKVLNEQEVDLRNMQLASTSPVAPVDDSYRQSLRQVDEFIADCERRVKAAPEDDLAREYLSNAYQQKAELLSAMMDREGSLH
jgi:hypothetical protein